MCCCQETPQECSHTSVRRLAPTAFLQLCSPEPHSRNSPRSVGRRTGKHPATHTHDGGPLGARRAEDLEVAPRDRGRHRSAVRVKPFHETRERKVLLSDRGTFHGGGIAGWGLPTWSVSVQALVTPNSRQPVICGFYQISVKDFRITPSPPASVSTSMDRASGPTSHVLGQWLLLIVILLLDPASSGVLG